MRSKFRSYLGCAALIISAMLAGCATVAPPPKNYTAFRAEHPRSILVVPALNNTSNVTAADFFLSTISRPFAERGYYVFPAHMVRALLNENGLSDAGLIHGTDPKRLQRLFGCDSVLFIAIQRWDSKYAVIVTSTTVSLEYTLKSCTTGATLWSDSQILTYSPQANSSSGNPLVDLVAQAVISAIEKGAPNYIPMAMQANATAAGTPGRGLPAGPYLEAEYGKDGKVFP